MNIAILNYEEAVDQKLIAHYLSSGIQTKEKLKFHSQKGLKRQNEESTGDADHAV